MDIFIAPIVFSNRELFDTLIKNLESVFHKPIKQLTLDIDTINFIPLTGVSIIQRASSNKP